MIVLGRKKLLARLGVALAIAAVLGVLSVETWLAVFSKSTTNCPFRVPSQHLSTGRSFNGYTDRGGCIRLGRVTTTQDLEEGLSGRAFMPRDEGLLFIFSKSDTQCMWMKDMRFNLDMIWLDASKTINHIETNLSPQTYPTSYCGSGNALYVIEVNSGVAKSAKLKVGDKLNF